jgi:hypothetical protein
MRRIFISWVFAWFLIIQSFGIDGRAVGVIPVQDENYCNNIINAIRYRGWVNVDYYCVDVGKLHV